MRMYDRVLNLREQLTRRSMFLFGPRQTGKSTLLKQLFPGAVLYDLLQADTFRELAARPELVRQRLGPEKLVIVDEIQRLPALLNEVHSMLSGDRTLRFVLTGSSARSLRRGGVNLLGGRAGIARLFPLVWPELPGEGLDRRLSYGSLPAVYTSDEPDADLKAYVGAYLQEEIRAEGLVRSIETFTRFLEVAALSNGQLVNFTAVGSDSGVPARTVREHFQLLDDTLLGSMLEPFREGRQRKPVSTAKFYLFDVGVANHLMNRGAVQAGSREYGQALEHLIYLELRAWLSYRQKDWPLTFWRTQAAQFEVDFVLQGHTGIEVKAANSVSDRDLKGLRALSEETSLKRRIVVCQERFPRQTSDGIEIMPVAHFLDSLWAGQIA